MVLIDENFKKWLTFKNKWSIIVLIILILIILSAFYVPFLIHLVSKNYLDSKIVSFSNSLTENISFTEDKLKTILNWQKENYNGLWRYNEIFPYIFYKDKKIIFCIRTNKDNDPSWVFLSKCGYCGESALLFREMTNALNLTSRIMKNTGEDHTWVEVLVNNSWIIIDPSSGRYNLSIDSFTNSKNLSYVYGLYPNGTKIDLTGRYTKTGNLIIKINKNLNNPFVEVFSNFLKSPRPTNIICEWKENICELRLGANNYTITSYAGNLIKYSETKNILLKNNETIQVLFNPKKINFSLMFRNKYYILILCLSYIIFIWGISGFFISFFKPKPKKPLLISELNE